MKMLRLIYISTVSRYQAVLCPNRPMNLKDATISSLDGILSAINVYEMLLVLIKSEKDSHSKPEVEETQTNNQVLIP